MSATQPDTRDPQPVDNSPVTRPKLYWISGPGKAHRIVSGCTEMTRKQGVIQTPVANIPADTPRCQNCFKPDARNFITGRTGTGWPRNFHPVPGGKP